MDIVKSVNFFLYDICNPHTYIYKHDKLTMGRIQLEKIVFYESIS